MDVLRSRFSKNRLEEEGYHVVYGEDIFHSENDRSTSAQKRAIEIMNGVQNKNIDLLLAISGGEYAMEILPYLDWEVIKKNPTWIQGFSDITILTYTITTHCDIATIYASNMKDFAMETLHPTLENNLKLWKGDVVEQHSEKWYENEHKTYVTGRENYNLATNGNWKGKPCKIEGRLLGGCLDVLSVLCGTKYDKTVEFIERYRHEGILWYLENCELKEADFVRTLWKLKESGWFQYANGIIFGRSSVNEKEWKQSLEEITQEQLGDLDIPILYDVDFGHKPPRMTVINGAYGIIEWNGIFGTFQNVI